MGEITNYLAGEYTNTQRYIEQVTKYGCTKMAPLIISCAITGGVQGAETNPNLPEKPDAQAASTYDAYNAGASMVHIHARDPQNPARNSPNWEDFFTVNQKVRDKCPNIIINNNMLGGRLISADTWKAGDPICHSMKAKPEVASFDITAVSQDFLLRGRSPELGGSPNDYTFHWNYMLTPGDAEDVGRKLAENGVKPEFEMFSLNDFKYLYNLRKKEIIPPPYWIQMVFGGMGTFPFPENLTTITSMLPPDSLLSVISVGAIQLPMMAMAIAMGHHVRVGMEDSYFLSPGILADSNAQLVESAVQLARLMGRPIATPEQARQMLGLGAPRQY